MKKEEHHWRMISVSMEDYRELIMEEMPSEAILKIVFCMIHMDEKDYETYLYSAAAYFYALSRIITYKDGKVYKYTAGEYSDILFDGYIEDEEELRKGLSHRLFGYTLKENDYNHFCALKKAICHWLSIKDELIYIYEYAGLIDYVLHSEVLPEPLYKEDALFMHNWKGYDPVSNKMAKELYDKYAL